MVISARPKILLQLIHKDTPGGPGASIREQVLEVPAQKGSYVGLGGGTDSVSLDWEQIPSESRGLSMGEEGSGPHIDGT